MKKSSLAADAKPKIKPETKPVIPSPAQSKPTTAQAKPAATQPKPVVTEKKPAAPTVSAPAAQSQKRKAEEIDSPAKPTAPPGPTDGSSKKQKKKLAKKMKMESEGAVAGGATGKPAAATSKPALGGVKPQKVGL